MIQKIIMNYCSVYRIMSKTEVSCLKLCVQLQVNFIPSVLGKP